MAISPPKKFKIPTRLDQIGSKLLQQWICGDFGGQVVKKFDYKPATRST